jgi:hypothetical protein
MGGRGVIRLKNVHAFRDRTGRMRYYFRLNGKRTPLLDLPGPSEFMDAYAVLLSNRPKSDGATADRKTPVGALARSGRNSEFGAADLRFAGNARPRAGILRIGILGANP